MLYIFPSLSSRKKKRKRKHLYSYKYRFLSFEKVETATKIPLCIILSVNATRQWAMQGEPLILQLVSLTLTKSFKSCKWVRRIFVFSYTTLSFGGFSFKFKFIWKRNGLSLELIFKKIYILQDFWRQTR